MGILSTSLLRSVCNEYNPTKKTQEFGDFSQLLLGPVWKGPAQTRIHQSTGRHSGRSWVWILWTGGGDVGEAAPAADAPGVGFEGHEGVSSTCVER